MFRAGFWARLLLAASLSIAVMAPSAICNDSGPSPRYGCRMVYDPVNERLMMFGGTYEGTPAQVHGDTWVFDWGTESWMLLEVELSPSPREDYGITYVPELGSFILFGGWNKGGRLGDTWLFDCASQTWTELHPETAPEVRTSFGFCCDEANGVVVLYGGYTDALPDMGDTWLYDYAANTWTETTPENSPPSLYGCEMIYDSATRSVLLFGGHYYENDRDFFIKTVWEYDAAANAWTERQTQGGPSERYWQNTAYNSQDGTVIVFGGRRLGSQYDDTWLYSPGDNTWTRLSVAHSPQARFQSAFAYDPTHDAVVLFGGFTFLNRQNFGDTWILDLSQESTDWRQAGAGTQPEAGPTPGIAGFPVETILIGMLVILPLLASPSRASLRARCNDACACFRGFYCPHLPKKHVYNALFLLSILLITSIGPPSTLAADSSGPSERYGAAMAYDEANKRLILFGGSQWDEGIFYDDTWTYNYSSNTWAMINLENRPPSRFNPGIAYIPDRQAVLIFGGYRTPDRHLGDTWLFDVKTDTWRELTPQSSPTPRGNMGMAYDAKSRRVILFGGSSDSEHPTSDTWVYDFESNTWMEMHPAVSPKPQYGVGMVYDFINEQVLLIEGHWVTRESGVVRDGYDGGLYTYDVAADTWRLVESSAPRGR